MEQRLDAVVSASAPAARSPGCRATSRAISPQTEMVLADPVGSILADYVKTGTLGGPARGWSRASARTSCRRSAIFPRVKKAYAIPTRRAFATARELLQKEGILGGSSTGTLLAAAPALLPRADRAQARRRASSATRQQVPVEDVQRLLDAGPGLPRARATHGDLRDLIARRHRAHGTPSSVAPTNVLRSLPR